MSMSIKEEEEYNNLSQLVDYQDRKNNMEIPVTSDGDVLSVEHIMKIEKEVTTSPAEELGGMTKEELFRMVDRGERPEWLPYQSFKELRKRCKKEREDRLKGTLFHVSCIRDAKTNEKIIGNTYRKNG